MESPLLEAPSYLVLRFYLTPSLLTVIWHIMASHQRSNRELPRIKLCETPPEFPYLTKLLSQKPIRQRTRPVFDINRYYSPPVLLEPSLHTHKLVHCRTTSCLPTPVKAPSTPKILDTLPKLSRLSPILILKEIYSSKPRGHRCRSMRTFDK